MFDISAEDDAAIAHEPEVGRSPGERAQQNNDNNLFMGICSILPEIAGGIDELPVEDIISQRPLGMDSLQCSMECASSSVQ